MFFSSAQLLSHVWLFETPWTTYSLPGFLSITNFWNLLKFMSIDSLMPSHPLSYPSPPTFNLSQHQGLFKWVSFSHQVPKVFGALASASVPPMNIQDWFPLGCTGWISLKPKGLSRVFSNTTVQRSAFFTVQLSHSYMTTGKTIALTRWTFVGKVMSLLFNILHHLQPFPH